MTVTRLRLAIALFLLASPAPALASDFSGLYYGLLGLGAVLAAIVAFVVWRMRRSRRRTARGDVVAAILLGLGCAPAGFVTGYDGITFELLPAWIWLWISGLEGGGPIDIAGPLCSIFVVSMVAYLAFRRRHDEGDPS